MQREIPIKAMEEEAEAIREAGMIKHNKISTVRIGNDTNAVKRYNHHTIVKIQKG